MNRCRSICFVLSVCAGFIAGPLLWGVNTQLGQILPYVECGGSFRFSAAISIAATILAALSGVLSWRAVHSAWDTDEKRSPALRFIGSLSGLAGWLFAYTLALQGAASLVLTACER
jgi:hypothetical protein